ncbi:hypothetical protein GBA52_029188 [Prunus armeniaca]|nr:hypothetical protein GBA52_029188 [Prunus armeniaca]
MSCILIHFGVFRITLPGGQEKEGKRWITSPFDIAREISKSLASNALISEVNGVLWDMNRPLEGDCTLKIFKFEDDVGRDTFWHSSAHILGQALEVEYGCKLCIGPCTTRGEGFYYDAFYGDLGLNDEHFKEIVSAAEKGVKFLDWLYLYPQDKQPFERIEVSRNRHLRFFLIINSRRLQRTGGNKDRESLQRVYGISYPDKKSLQLYIQKLEEAKKYDHRLLGTKQELFFCHPLSPGSWFFLPNGARIYKKLMTFIQNQYIERGYHEVISPNVYNMQLWETSGHAANYKENMFVFENFHLDWLILVFCIGMRASGALTGLTRVRRFQQRPEKYLGDVATWEKAEAALTEALNESGKPWQLNEGDGAFYGPKIDISVSDALNRKFQCATLQVCDDHFLPARFELYYSAEGEEGKRETPVMIHRAILGSVERMFAILLEHYKGKWPFWLSPRQAIVCPVSDKSQPYALEVRNRIHQAGYYVDVDTSDRTIQKKVREAQMAQYNYILVVGEEEVKTGQVSLRVRDKGDVTVMSMENLLQHFKAEVEAFH